MARVLALVPDLLFGSNVQGSLTAGGHQVELIGSAARLRERLAADDAPPAGKASAAGNASGLGSAPPEATAPSAVVLVVDLTDAQLDGASLLEALAAEQRLDGLRTLAFYSHVDAAVRERAEQAGFDLVVPRSRMAREGAALVARLADGE